MLKVKLSEGGGRFGAAAVLPCCRVCLRLHFAIIFFLLSGVYAGVIFFVPGFLGHVLSNPFICSDSFQEIAHC